MITITVNNKIVTIHNGSTVSAAVFASGAHQFRRSVGGDPRGPLCGMGICFECRASINGIRHQRSCQILAEEGMVIESDE